MRLTCNLLPHTAVFLNNLPTFKAHEAYCCRQVCGWGMETPVCMPTDRHQHQHIQPTSPQVRASAYLKKLRKETPLLDAWLARCREKVTECRSMDLASFLLAPVQRVTKVRM